MVKIGIQYFLNVGDYLIDDRDKNGSDRFQGNLLKFGSSEFLSWNEVIKYLDKVENLS